jgi:hypothetical protein
MNYNPLNCKIDLCATERSAYISAEQENSFNEGKPMADLLFFGGYFGK